jgi:aminomethyltransferase
MPVLYTSIVAEHHAVRTQAGIFDVSHMGEVRLRGPSAIGLAERIFTNHASKTGEGRVRYGLLCLEDGGVVDDVTLLRTEHRG